MVVEIFTQIPFQPLSQPTDEETVTVNCFMVSLRGAYACGGTALVSFLFNRFLAQEGVLKALAPYVFKASLTSGTTFVAFAFMTSAGFTTKGLSNKMSLLAKRCSLVGMIGAAVAFAARIVTPNSLIGSLANRSLSPLLGLGTAGSILWIFLNSQHKQMAALNKKNQSNDKI